MYREKMGDGTTRLTGMTLDDIVAALMPAVLLAANPVGSIYFSVEDVNPGDIFGGTWIAWGSGRVPVGVNPAETEFDTVEETGGEKTHVLTAAQMPTHAHPHPNGGDWRYASIRDIAGRSGKLGATSGSNRLGFFSDTSYADLDLDSATANAGSGQAHNNLQPYITCYMWKRTA